jgi:cellulose synthase/poly-beta-1,6-N-acetylglucosamine synthase-like glycosyltransferase
VEWATKASGVMTTVFWAAFLVAGMLTVGRLLLMVVLARRHGRKRRAWLWGAPVTEPVSVIVPAYNEREGIEATVRSIAGSDHPVEVIVVDDGSTDGTADLVESLGLPNVTVVRKGNGGKPSSLNAGIRVARYDLLVLVDGDTRFEPDTVRRLVQPFAAPLVGGVSGNAKVGNRRGLRVAGSTSSTSWASTSTAACTTSCSACPPCPGLSAPSAAGRSPRRGGSVATRSRRTPT